MILGIIPAGGKAERFGSYPKEMLPCGKNQTLLDRTVMALNHGSADRILILTSPEKIAIHAGQLGPGYDYRISRDTVWHSIMESFAYQADWNLYAMPDTYYPQDVFDQSEMHRMDFNVGLFETTRADRFGVLIDGQIHDKEKLPPKTYLAWGVLCWTKNVVDFWLRNLEQIKTHTDAFNLAMKEFGYQACKVKYYFDMASWDDYKYFIQGEL
jgi:hypothetical protein